MPYPFQKPSQDVSDGSIGMAFRVTAALLAGVAVLLFCLLATDAGLTGATAWLLAAASAGAVFLLAQSLVAAIMVALAPVLIIAVLVRFVLG
jgi:hypothetical protein